MASADGKNRRYFGISVLFTLFCYAFFLVTRPVYFHSDNWEVAVVTAGYYGPNLCQYLHPLLCVVIGGLSRLLPTADVFTLLVHLALGTGITLTSFMSLEGYDGMLREKGRIEAFLFLGTAILAELFISEALRVWNANYNIQTAAVLFFGTVILFSSLDDNRSAGWTVAGAGLILFGLMLRVAVACLFVPYYLLEILVRFLESRNVRDENSMQERSEDRRAFKAQKYCLVALCSAAILLVLSRMVLLSVEPYRSAELYNRYRTTAVDYPMKDWRKLEDPAFSESDYLTATDWLYIDTEQLDLETMEKIARDGARPEYEVSDLKGILHDMRNRAVRTDVYMFVLLILSLLLVLRNLLCAGTFPGKLGTVLAFAGSFLILYYFTCRGRAPHRVWQPVLLAADAVLILTARKKTSRRVVSAWFSVCFFAVLWFSAGQLIAHAEFRSPQNILTARTGADDSAYEQTFQGRSLYIWPNWHATIPDHFIEQGKLPTKRVLEHNVAAGDWTTEQVYYKDFLKGIGVTNLAEALVERDDVYLMDGYTSAVLSQLKEHYGEDLVLVPAGEVNGVSAWKVMRSGPEKTVMRGEQKN